MQGSFFPSSSGQRDGFSLGILGVYVATMTGASLRKGQKRGKNYSRNSLYTLQLCGAAFPGPLARKRASLLGFFLLFMSVAQFCDSGYPGVKAGK